jgi:hypothetical protein
VRAAPQWHGAMVAAGGRPVDGRLRQTPGDARSATSRY